MGIFCGRHRAYNAKWHWEKSTKKILTYFFVSHHMLPSSRGQAIDNDENNECRTDAGAKQWLHQGLRHRPWQRGWREWTLWIAEKSLIKPNILLNLTLKESGCCAAVITFFSYVFVFLTLPLSIWGCVKVCAIIIQIWYLSKILHLYLWIYNVHCISTDVSSFMPCFSILWVTLLLIVISRWSRSTNALSSSDLEGLSILIMTMMFKIS